MSDVYITAAAGLVASFLSGLLGIGGGVVLTPALLYGPGLLGAPILPVKIITGLSVVQAISASVIGALRHHRYGNVSLRIVRLMAPTSALASFAGALASGAMPDRLLIGVFAAFALLGAVTLTLPERGPAQPVDDLHVNVPLAVGIAAGLGFFGGMVGIGAVSFIIAALVYLLRIPVRTAIGTSLGIGLFAAVAALVGKAATAQLDLPLAAVVLVGAVLASPAGAWVSVRTHPGLLVRLLALVIALAGVRMAWQALTGM